MNIYTGPLNITMATWEEAARVQAYAFQHRETLRALRNRMSTGTKPPGMDEGHCLSIPVGYKVVYAIEQNAPGWCHHLLIYVTQPKMDPNPGAVTRILELFGITARGPKGVLVEALDIADEKISNITVGKSLLYPIKDFGAMQKRMEELSQAATKSE